MKTFASFGERLSEIIQERNITAKELANELGFSHRAINHWRKNERDIRLSNLIAISRYFNYSLEYLVGRAEINYKPTFKTLPKFSDSVRMVMKKRGVTSYKIRNETQFSGGFFNDWDKGTEPQLSTLIELANYLNCSLDELVGLE